MNNRPILEGTSLTVSYGQVPVLGGVGVTFAAGTVTVLVGPNGSGKSTLLRTLARLLRPQHGAVYIDGIALTQLSSRDTARRLAMLPQGPSNPEGMRVRELVEQGRYPHQGPLRMLHKRDDAAIDWALHLTGMKVFANRSMGQLSGGQRQRAWIAAALAQETPLLLLDEPTTFLDIKFQLEILDLVIRLCRDEHLTVAMALHDLNQAARIADRIIALRDGCIAADGNPTEVLTPENVAAIFEVRSQMLYEENTGALVCIPYAPITIPEQ